MCYNNHIYVISQLNSEQLLSGDIQIMKTAGKEAIQRVHDEIKDQIIHHELKPGTRLTELEICKNKNIGRSTARNALISLSQTGLVELIPNIGARVTEFTRDQIVSLFEAKIGLQMYALERTLNYYFETDYKALNSIINEGKKGIANRDLLAYLKASEAFNNYIVDKVGNEYLSNAFHYMSTENTVYQILYDEFYNIPLEDFASTKCYPIIVQAIKERDLEKARLTLEEIAQVIITRYDHMIRGTSDAYVYSSLFE